MPVVVDDQTLFDLLAGHADDLGVESNRGELFTTGSGTTTWHERRQWAAGSDDSCWTPRLWSGYPPRCSLPLLPN